MPSTKEDMQVMVKTISKLIQIVTTLVEAVEKSGNRITNIEKVVLDLHDTVYNHIARDNEDD